MQSKITSTTLRAVNTDVLDALGKSHKATEASSWARLRSVLGLRASEALFADGVILVEGDEDEAVIAAVADWRDISLDALGIAVVPAEGKTKLPNLLALYRRIGLRTYTVFDADCDEKSDEEAHTIYNEAILKMNSQKPEKRPNTTIHANVAVWNITLVHAVRDGFGHDVWDKAFEAACIEYSLPADQARKKYAVIWQTVGSLLRDGKKCPLLEDLWAAITTLFGIEKGSVL